jgi:hypothetical protein
VDVMPMGPVMFDLATLEWNRDGTLDLVCRDSNGEARVQLNDGLGGLWDGIGLSANEVSSVVPTDYGGGLVSDVVVQDVASAEIYLGTFGGDSVPDVILPGEQHGVRQLLSGNIDEPYPYEVVGYTRLDGWLLLELWANGGGTPQRFALTGDETLAGMGDYDGDGARDVIATGGEVISYVRGSGENGYPTLTCRSSYFFGAPTISLAVDDFDGNGRADVATDRGGGGVSILLSF